MPEAHDSRRKGIRLAEEYRRRLTESLGEHIEVTLFGSQARGDATAESDLDVLVILPDLEKGTLDVALEVAWEVGFAAGKVISVIPVTSQEIEFLSESPFLQTVRREGIAV